MVAKESEQNFISSYCNTCSGRGVSGKDSNNFDTSKCELISKKPSKERSILNHEQLQKPFGSNGVFSMHTPSSYCEGDTGGMKSTNPTKIDTERLGKIEVVQV